MKKEEFIATCLLLCSSLAVGQLHPGTYHAGNDIYCNKCPPGHYVNKDCTSKDPTPDCQPCELGKQFQPDWTRATTCAPCRTCNYVSREEIKENCNTTANTVCQCEAGYYKTSETEDKFVCNEHTKCKPGEGLMRPGDRENNTICTTCINGSTYWESSTKPCQSCSNCATELCKPFCMQANPVPGWAIGLIIVLVIVVVAVAFAVVLIFRACNGKGPMCLQNCCHGQSSTSDQENPLESVQFLQNGQIHDEIDLGAQQSNQSTSQVPVSAQQTDGIPSTLLKDLSKDLISREWQFFFRALFPEGSNVDKEIERVQIDHQNNIAEQIYQMLLVWKQKEGCRATMDRIVDVMKNEKMHSLADKYKDFCQAPSQPNGRISYPRANGHSIDVLPTAPPADDVVSNSGNTTDSTGPGPVSENGHIGINGTL